MCFMGHLMTVARSAGVFFECAMLKLPEERRKWGESRERGGGGEREEKTPFRKHCENEKHPLIQTRVTALPEMSSRQ